MKRFGLAGVILACCIELSGCVNSAYYNDLAAKKTDAVLQQIKEGKIHPNEKYNSPDSFGDPSPNTPLHIAIGLGNARVARELIQRGADLYAPSNNFRMEPPFAKILNLSPYYPDTSMLGILDDMLEAGFDVNRPITLEYPTETTTPLIALLDAIPGDLNPEDVAKDKNLAARVAKKEAVLEHLLKKGANVSAPYNAIYQTNSLDWLKDKQPTVVSWPVINAAETGGKRSAKLLSLLLDAGADPWVVNAKGSVLSIAARVGGPEAIAVIVDGAVRYRSQDPANKKSASELRREFVNRNRPEAPNALNNAIIANRQANVLALLEVGADPNQLNQSNGFFDDASYSDQLSAMHVAAAMGHQQIIDLLIAHGGDLEKRTGSGKSFDDLTHMKVASDERRAAAEAAQAKADADARIAAEEQKRREGAAGDGFQWGKLAALGAGAAIGGLNRLPSDVQAKVVTGMVQDSMAGQQGVSNFRAAVADGGAQRASAAANEQSIRMAEGSRPNVLDMTAASEKRLAEQNQQWRADAERQQSQQAEQDRRQNTNTPSHAAGQSNRYGVAGQGQGASGSMSPTNGGATGTSRGSDSSENGWSRSAGRVVNTKYYAYGLEEHQANTWCEREVADMRKIYSTGRNKLISIGACSCKQYKDDIQFQKQYKCEFPYSYQEFESASR